MASSPSSPSTPDLSTIPLAYRIFFLYLEPLTALVGASFATLAPAQYLAHLSPPPPSSFPSDPETGTLVAVYQLANLFLFCALSEALVLRSTASRRTWRALLGALLVADAGHLATLLPLARAGGFVSGDAAFVYVAAGMRVAFLLGFGFKRPSTEAGREGQPLVGGDDVD
ncbi:hypothetical protein GSI_01348 [Ganoderma sinense ZZ0214-1]|uniref:DUF7704 domain-containing protein n=1 Tax=Ganoderma sinense ZZ0214-1 TaxID=1077348 RepID=A0A2G8SV66_9APHY|nr:hypothetical protein GSI_01348 [Ganoderma sinense ZZ0214-1]